MSKFIKDEIKHIAISGIRQFNQKANDVEGVIRLTLGELDFDTFPHIKEAVAWAAQNNKTRYTPNAGLEELRRKISYRYEHYNLPEIFVTVGTTEGLAIIIKSTIQPGDEVIIPTPAYVGYEPLIKMERGIVKEIDLTQSNFRLSRAQLDQAYSKKTKALLITNPNNPTGIILNSEEMETIRDFVLEKDILLISDEVYSEIDFFGKFKSFTDYPELKENLLVLDGFSKSHAMTGFRIGYVLGDELTMKELLKTHQYTVTSATSISQYAALAAHDDDSAFIVEELRKRREFLCHEFAEADIRCICPEGAFYVYIDISRYSKSSIAFCERLLYRYKVAAIPGESFLGHDPRFIRINYAIDMDDLKEAIRRLKEFILERKEKNAN